MVAAVSEDATAQGSGIKQRVPIQFSHNTMEMIIYMSTNDKKPPSTVLSKNFRKVNIHLKTEPAKTGGDPGLRLQRTNRPLRIRSENLK